MLAYLDAVIAALTARDRGAVEHLLGHPLARILTTAARAEVDAFRDGTRDLLAAPLLLMQLRRQTAELLRDASVIADRPEAAEGPRGARPQDRARGRRAVRPVRMVQMELPLSA